VAKLDLPTRWKEPCARHTIFKAFREAARDCFREDGLLALAARLSPECRQFTVDAIAISELWLPERYVMEWYEAAFAGPCDCDRARYVRFIDRMMDFGFGRVRKALAGVVSASRMLRMSTELWRDDHTTGTLLLLRCDTDTREALVELRDHPYATTPLARDTIAEIYRYCLSLARVKTVSQSHALVEGRLQVTLRWT
jgi:hypothetical protein